MSGTPAPGLAEAHGVAPSLTSMTTAIGRRGSMLGDPKADVGLGKKLVLRSRRQLLVSNFKLCEIVTALEVGREKPKSQ